MEKFIVNANATYIKNIFITDSFIKVTDENYKTLAAFLEKVNKNKKGVLDTQHHIKYNNIEKVVLYENELTYQVYFKENNKNEMTVFHLNDLDEYNEVLDLILSKSNLLKSELTIRTRAWVKPVLYALIPAVLTFALYMFAKQMAVGENISVSGSRRGLKKIMIQIAEQLGATNVLILGSVITCAFIYFAYRAFQKSTVIQEAFIKQK